MIKLIIRQLFFVVTTFIGVTFITFYLQTLSSDSAVNVSITKTSLSIINPVTTPVSDKSYVQRYFNYLSDVVQGNLGFSKSTRTLVSDEYFSHLGASVELVVLASILALGIGLPLGIFASINYKKPADTLINNLALAAYSMPIFWWGIILIMFFSLNLGITPVAGRLSFLFDIEPVTGFILIDTLISNESYRIDAFKDAIWHLILPVIVLATLPTAIIIQLIRRTMLDTLSMDYILTAQAKGLSGFQIYWIHGLRNALIPFTNLLGLQLGTLMTGAMLTEYLFAWPGIGKWIIDALQRNDYQSLQGGILITASMVIVLNSVVEILQAWLNPQTRTNNRIYNG